MQAVFQTKNLARNWNKMWHFWAYLCWKVKAENGKVKNSHTRYDEVDNMEESFSSDDYVKENI